MTDGAAPTTGQALRRSVRLPGFLRLQTATLINGFGGWMLTIVLLLRVTGSPVQTASVLAVDLIVGQLSAYSTTTSPCAARGSAARPSALLWSGRVNPSLVSTALSRDAQHTIHILRMYLDKFFPGSIVEMPAFEAARSAPIDGFAVNYAGGLAIMFIRRDGCGADRAMGSAECRRDGACRVGGCGHQRHSGPSSRAASTATGSVRTISERTQCTRRTAPSAEGWAHHRAPVEARKPPLWTCPRGRKGFGQEQGRSR
jgi:hypothetical protein